MVERQRDFIRRQLLMAAEAGHELRIEFRDRTAEFGNAPGAKKFWAVCSCGWSSSMRATQQTAVMVAIWHCGMVVPLTEEERLEARRVGLKIPAGAGSRL